MTKEPIMGKGVAAPGGPYSQAIVAQSKRTLYIAGQVPVDDKGNLIGRGDVEAQARKVFENIRALCEAAGGSLKNVVFVTIYVTDMRFRPVITKVRNEMLEPPYPAATMVQIDALADENWLVEVDAVAALD